MSAQRRRGSRDASILRPMGTTGLVSNGMDIGTGSWDGEYIGVGSRMWVVCAYVGAVQA